MLDTSWVLQSIATYIWLSWVLCRWSLHIHSCCEWKVWVYTYVWTPCSNHPPSLSIVLKSALLSSLLSLASLEVPSQQHSLAPDITYPSNMAANHQVLEQGHLKIKELKRVASHPNFTYTSYTLPHRKYRSTRCSASVTRLRTTLICGI